MAKFRIRRADEHRDWRALRLLLPAAIHHSCGCDAFVATDDEAAQRVIGVVAVAPLMRLKPLQGPRVAIHVIAPWRGRGVARALRDAASGVAAARGAEALYAWDRIDPDSDEAIAWRALGFDHVIHCPLNRIDATRTVDALQPLFDRLQQRGQIPAEAQVVRPQDADLDQIVDLVTTYLAGASPQEALKQRLLGRHPTPLDPILSRVLLYQGRVVAAMLGRQVNDQVAWVEVNVVHSSVRGRWANVWLKLEATRHARDLGFQTFLYETYDQHADTAKLTSRLGGVLMPRVELYHVIPSNHR
jgi:GNAT superfamily N-acetyltransferase